MKIKSGPDLDLAVAEVVGFEAELYRGSCLVDVVKPHKGKHTSSSAGTKVFCPSTDMTDAMEAMELLGQKHVVALYTPAADEKGWTVTILKAHLPHAHGPTGQLAICAAILKLKEETDD